MMSEQSYNPKTEQIGKDLWKVESEKHEGVFYIVGPNSCSCIGWKYRQDCKHVRLVQKKIKDLEQKNASKTHEHRIRCIGCNFRTTIERCSCSEPDKQEFVCYECQGVHAIEQWKGVNGDNEDRV